MSAQACMIMLGAYTQVEAMKSRKIARAMTDYMRKVNPELASALTDERDEVCACHELSLRSVGFQSAAWLCLAWLSM